MKSLCMCLLDLCLLLVLIKSSVAQEPKKTPVNNADPTKVAEAVKQIDILMTATPEKLKIIAKQLANEAREVGYTGSALAKIQVQEEMLVNMRAEAISMAADAAKERKAIFAELQKTIKDINDQYKNDSAQSDREVAKVVANYLPILQHLKGSELEYNAVVQKTDLRLVQLRNEKASLEREGLSIRKGIIDRTGISISVDIPELQLKYGNATTPAATKPLKELLDELKKLE